MWGPGRGGGYALPVTIGGSGDQLFDEQECSTVAAKTRDVFVAINNGDVDAFDRVIPDSVYRPYVIDAFGQMQPDRHSGWIMHIEDYQNNRVLDGTISYDRIKKRFEPRLSEESPADFGYVAGSLIEMKFNERRLRLKLLKWNKPINATYADAFEPMLLTHPRDRIQLHGNIVFGDDGDPQEISDVDDILEIDESPIDIDFIRLKDGSLIKPIASLQFDIVFDDESWLYQATGPFGIQLYDQTRSEIETQVYDEIEMLWFEYAKEDSAVLTSGAQQLQRELLGAFREVTDAT